MRLGVDPNNPRRYLARDGYRDFSVRKEVVRIAGGDATTINFDETIWGPVRNADGQCCAVQWMARAANASNIALMRFEQLGSVAAALKAAADFGRPPQNLAVVDDQGNAGWAIAGAFPAQLVGVDRRRALTFRSAPAVS